MKVIPFLVLKKLKRAATTFVAALFA